MDVDVDNSFTLIKIASHSFDLDFGVGKKAVRQPEIEVFVMYAWEDKRRQGGDTSRSHGSRA